MWPQEGLLPLQAAQRALCAGGSPLCAGTAAWRAGALHGSGGLLDGRADVSVGKTLVTSEGTFSSIISSHLTTAREVGVKKPSPSFHRGGKTSTNRGSDFAMVHPELARGGPDPQPQLLFQRPVLLCGGEAPLL